MNRNTSGAMFAAILTAVALTKGIDAAWMAVLVMVGANIIAEECLRGMSEQNITRNRFDVFKAVWTGCAIVSWGAAIAAVAALII